MLWLTLGDRTVAPAMIRGLDGNAQTMSDMEERNKMSDQPHRPLSALKLVLLYATTLIVGAVVVNLLIWAADEFLDMRFENSAMGLVLVFVAAAALGQFWYAREGAQPASGRIWMIAMLCTLVTVGLQGVLMLLSYRYAALGSPSPLGELRDEDQMILIGVAAALVVVVLLLIRLGIWVGMRQGAKQESIRAQK